MGLRVALTGATGFIGKQIQNALLQAGFKIKCLNRRKSSVNSEYIEESLIDLKSVESLRRATSDVDAVIYVAGSVKGKTISDFTVANVDGIQNICKALVTQRKNTPVLLISSLAASEPNLSSYSASKAAGETALIASGHKEWTIFRAPAVYGQGDKELRSLFKLFKLGIIPAVAPLEQRLPFMEVTDLARATVAWSLSVTRCQNKIYTLNDGKNDGYNWYEIAEQISKRKPLFINIPFPFLDTISRVNLVAARIFGYQPMLSPGKVRELTHMNWKGDNSQLTLDTGWIPKIGLHQGVSNLFSSTRQNGVES